MNAAILTPLPHCPERDARHAATDAAIAAVEEILARAVDAARAGLDVEHLLADAVAISDAATPGDVHDSHVRITRRMFERRLAGWKPDYTSTF